MRLRKTGWLWCGLGAGSAVLGAVLFMGTPAPGEPRHRSVLTPAEDLTSFPYISERDYLTLMPAEVVPYLESRKQAGTFRGAAGAVLYYEAHTVENPRGTVVLSHGLGESVEKYQELTYYLLKDGFSVWAYDHRGHSRSTRLAEDGSRVNLDRYGYFADDMKTFLDQVVRHRGSKLFLFAHSMGGGIGALFLERYPGYFAAAVLNAPMMEINTGATPEPVTAATAWIFRSVGLGNGYVFGEEPYSPVPNFEAGNTASWQRYYWYQGLQASRPEVQNGGVTWGWLDQAMALTREVTAPENARKVTVPVLVFQAGRDTLVAPGGHLRFTSEAPRSELVVVPGAKHEIYRETDRILFPYLDRVLGFFTREAGH